MNKKLGTGMDFRAIITNGILIGIPRIANGLVRFICSKIGIL
jgi:hypothetical protein